MGKRAFGVRLRKNTPNKNKNHHKEAGGHLISLEPSSTVAPMMHISSIAT